MVRLLVAGTAVAASLLFTNGPSKMVMRIERVSDGRLTILRLSGRLQSEHVEQLKAQIESSRERVVLDLEEVKLVDQDAVCFLAVCEANGIQLSQCSPYIRDWIARERAGRGDS